MRRWGAAIAFGMLVVAGCSGDDDAPATAATTAVATETTEVTEVTEATAGRFPDILDVVATVDESTDTWSFSVTVSSPYDTPERYADGWRVVGPDGTVYGVHTLTHDHAAEQPFTRRQAGVEIPADVATVTIEGRDQANGFGGGTFTVDLEGNRS